MNSQASRRSIPVLLAGVLLVAACGSYAEGPAPTMGAEIGTMDAAVEARVNQIFRESGIPSMAVAVVAGDQLVWAKGFGEQSDLATVYMVGSIDKPFLATALLQMLEQGQLGMEDDINDYLPFEVRNPHEPGTPITLRMLVSHRSGLVHDVQGLRYVDNDGPMLRWRFWHQSHRLSDLWNSFLPHSRREIIEEAFTAGASGDLAELWVGPPGRGFQYSNTAFYDLLGMAMEVVAGKPYQEVIQANVIAPLGMANTAFEAYTYPEDQLAIPYARF
nr:serine hydrolase [Anaerolineae bacterium]NIN97171.1 serine hydrolase [Anaerolineae bacterium]